MTGRRRVLALAAAALVSCLAAPAARAAECAKTCPQIYAPVCASSGKTFSSECAFKIEKCRTNDAALTIVKTGECTPSADTENGGTGNGNASGTPECIKEFACLDVEDPVCGSNGVTYTNACVLKKAQCVDKSIQKASEGACKKDTTSAPPSTSPSSSASGDGSSAIDGSVGADSDAVCSQICTKEIDYVCGSDGVSYANACLLEHEKACRSPTLTKARDGNCDGSDNTAASPSTTTQPPAKSDATARWGTAVAFACSLAAAAATA